MKHRIILGRMGWPRSIVTVACDTCGTPIQREPNQLKRATHSFCGRQCRALFLTQLTGASSPSWKGGRVQGPGPYLRIKVGRQHPMADRSGYVLEHRMVMSNHLGRPLGTDEHVHHINHDPGDNRIENLRVFQGNGAHRRCHQAGRAKRTCWCGRPHEARGLCTIHYAKQRRAASLLPNMHRPRSTVS